ncbi:hypothetical protein GCM10007860_25260 [Chitiniphilus shinanonensis]|uniref:Uncharacterized protein n=1 Tax=Chitiniphilus shinanonensis TaxID=553088 RepID=A0ABQ6BV68_9NEIS|nr:hypothetical protein [Chitiniphilus shinanonensis]GLS05374.1 hypothetical protein GCM10007860_25260 [Chitiniphilus shinanonensis]
MTMKRTELEKRRGLKINNKLKQDSAAQHGAQHGGAKQAQPLNPLLGKLLGKR